MALSSRTNGAQRTKRARRTPEDAEREILDAAEAFLREHDFRDLSVDELMRRTGMVRSTFYHYFPDRGAVIARLLEPIRDEMLAAAAGWLEGLDDDPTRAIARTLRRVAETWAGHGHMLRAAHEAAYHDPDVERLYLAMAVDAFATPLAALLRRERRAGRTAVSNPGEVARALMLMNVNVFAARLGRRPPDSPAAVARTLTQIWAGTIYPGVVACREGL